MPLIAPGINSSGDDKRMEWMNKLMGKKIGDSSDSITFARQDLPKEHRVLGPDTVTTRDYNPQRLNVHVDNDGTVKDVTHG